MKQTFHYTQTKRTIKLNIVIEKNTNDVDLTIQTA